MAINVYDQDYGSKDDHLGKCKITTNVIRTAITSGQLQDVWKLLEDVKRGSIHVEIGWCELKLNPSMPTKDEGGPAMRPGTSNGTGTGHHQAVITIVIDSCQNVISTNEGNKMKLPNPSVQCEVCGVTQITDPVIGSINPVYAHRMNFLVNDPEQDFISFSVIDEKNKKSENVVLGTTKIHISDLLVRTSLTMVKTKFPLERAKKGTKHQEHLEQKEQIICPMIVVSMAIRYIHRPKTSGYGAHKSLQDLHKIMQNKPTVAGSAVWRNLGDESSKTVEINNAINAVKNKIDDIDDNLRNKTRQGSQLIKNGLHTTGDFIYDQGAYGSHAIKSGYGAVKSKGAHGAHNLKDSVHKVDTYVKEKGAEGSQRAKETYATVRGRSVEATEVVKETVQMVNDYVYEKGVDGTHAVKKGYNTIHEKGVRGTHAIKEQLHTMDEYVHHAGAQSSHMVKHGISKVDEKARRTAAQTSQLAKDASYMAYQTGVDGTHTIKENLHKMDDSVRQTLAQGSQMVKENISKVDEVARKSGKQGSKMVIGSLSKVKEGIHQSNYVYNQHTPYLETDFHHNVRHSQSNPEGWKTVHDDVKPNFITTNDETSTVTNEADACLVAPLAQEESLTITNGFHSLASEENELLFKIRPEDATKYVKENSVRSNLIDVVKQPAEPPKPKIQLSLKYNLTNMTLSVVVHKIRNLHETAVTWLPSARVVTRVIEMSGISRFRRVVNTKRKTKTQRDNVSPVFEETLEYFLPVGDLKRRRLEVSVYHDSRFPGRFIGRNVVLGRCLVSKVK